MDYINSQLSYSLYKKIKIIADNKSLRIDKFIMIFLKNITRNQINKFIKNGYIIVNNAFVKCNYKINNYDIVEIKYNYIIIVGILSNYIPIDIIYEDQYIMIINKTADMVVHPGNGNYYRTLVNALKFYYEKNDIAIPVRMGLVHRIDKDTSGLIIIAKTNNIFYNLYSNFRNNMIKKTYLVFVWGTLINKSGLIEGYISRNINNRKKMDVFNYSDIGKYAITYYKILDTFKYVTYLSCFLEFGRTHQIRAHFKYINHPVFNDFLYGGNKISKGIQYYKYQLFFQNCFINLPRHAIHAYNISFIHPINKHKFFFQTNLPYDMSITLKKWRNLLLK